MAKREKRWWSNPKKLRLLPEDERRGVAATATVKPYWDPLLQRDSKSCEDFVSRLEKLGLVQCRRKALAEIGVFFVTKKNGGVRMVLEWRCSNVSSRAPPRT